MDPTAPADPLAPHAADILAHMNDDHAAAVRLYVLAFKGVAADDARMVAIDARGFDVECAAGRFRFDFDRPVTTPDEVLRMCRMVHACGYTTAQFGIPSDICAERALGLLAAGVEVDSPEQRVRYARMASCAQTAASCDAYTRCVDFDMPCNGTATPTCAGAVALRCSTPGGNHLPRSFDCATVGQTCMGGVCVLPAGPSECTNPGGVRCDGDVRVWCRPRAGGGNGEVREPCPTGTRCGASSSSAVCQPMPPCAAPAARCDGDTAVVCAAAAGPDGTRVMAESRSNCAAIGRRCATNARGLAQCVPTATECPALQPNAPSTARCDGTAITVCLEGTTTRIDCPSVGRTTCAMVMPPGGIGSPYAGCQ